MHSGKLLKTACAASFMVLMSGVTAHGAFQLIQFQPTPVSPNSAEFTWTGPGGHFVDSAGSHGNGDGEKSVATQTAGGLEIDTPLNITAPAGSGEVTENGKSRFYDVTLTLSSSSDTTSFHDTGAEVSTVLNEAFQSLSDGTFTLTATNGILLLSGAITNNSLTIPLNSSATTFEGGKVTYTGGLIFQTLLSQGYVAPVGDVSISMTTLDSSAVGVNYTGPGDGLLGEAPATVDRFTANATGVFDVVPEPATLGLAALAALWGCRRRRI